ncbi:MAG TPA: Gfo/Idh/MocA family oxidoreductase [Devosia sp.]
MPTDTAPFRLAIAGITHAHINILPRSTFKGMELVGIQESKEDFLKAYGVVHGHDPALLYTDLETMLDAVKPEAVAAFGSIREHMAVVEACAPRGIHVMVEKPMAIDVAEAERMEELAARHGIFILTNYETTWYATNHEAIARTADEGRYGKVRKVVIHDGHPGPKEIGCGPHFLEWLTDPELAGGGALPDFGCYGANLMTRIMQDQPPLRVSAVTHQFKPHLYPKVDDDATAIVSYADAEAIIQASWNWPVSRKDMEIYAERAQVIAMDNRHMRTRAGDKVDEAFETLPPLVAPYDDPFAHFAAVVRGEVILHKYDLAGLANNVVVVRILAAARESARTGKVVEVSKPKSR